MTARVCVAGLLLAAALWASGCGYLGCGGEEAPEAWVARVVELTGAVEIGPAGGGALSPAQQDQYICVGQRLQTGPGSMARLALRNGHDLTVNPNALVLFKKAGSNENLSLTLEQGTVIGGGAQVEASELVIGVGGRSVRLGGGDKARVQAPEGEGGNVKVAVSYGNAMVSGPNGEDLTVITGNQLVFGTGVAAPEPDAQVAPPDAGTADAVIVAPAQLFFLRSVGRGRVEIKRPAEKRFNVSRRGRWTEVPRGTEIRLRPRARMVFGAEKGQGAVYTGPALLKVREQDSDLAASDNVLEHLKGEIELSDAGEAGKITQPVSIEGVSVKPRITYRKLDVRIRRKGNGQVVAVKFGAATLVGKKRTVELEAGQEATLLQGDIKGPRGIPSAPFRVSHFGTVRVFVNDPKLPVTFRWGEKGSDAKLVQVSRYSNMRQPLFADVIKRNQLTLPGVSRGSVYWQVQDVDEAGKAGGEPDKGRLVLVRDTSFRVLKDYRPPTNIIRHEFGNTTVYYQNRPPKFIFTWNGISGVSDYNLKIFRENSLRTPLVNATTTKPAVKLRTGRLAEGTYLWYVVARGARGKRVQTLSSQRLSVRYDNATPDLQIVQPRNGAEVAAGAIVARGVALPGSKVFINGAEAELDGASRFDQKVSLKPGSNYIIFRVVDARRGSSFYLRRVVRR